MIFPYSGPSHSPACSSTEPLSLGKTGTRVLAQGAQEVRALPPRLSPAPQHSPTQASALPLSLFSHHSAGQLKGSFKNAWQNSQTDKGFPFLPTRSQVWTSLGLQAAGLCLAHRDPPRCPLPCSCHSTCAGLPTLRRHTVATLSLLGEALLGCLSETTLLLHLPTACTFLPSTYQHLPGHTCLLRLPLSRMQIS